PQDDFGAVNVGFNRPDRRFDDQFYADGRGHVEDDVGAVDQLGCERVVHDRVDDVLEPRLILQVDDVVHRTRGQVVDHHDLVTVHQQSLGEVRTNESGAAGEKSLHDPSVTPPGWAGVPARERIASAVLLAACPSDASSYREANAA